MIENRPDANGALNPKNGHSVILDGIAYDAFRLDGGRFEHAAYDRTKDVWNCTGLVRNGAGVNFRGFVWYEDNDDED